MSDFFFARSLMAMSLAFHIIFAALGIGMPLLMAIAQGMYPHLVTPDVTVVNSHAPEVTLRLLVLALGFGAIVLLPSLVFLFHIFKGREGAVAEGIHHEIK